MDLAEIVRNQRALEGPRRRRRRLPRQRKLRASGTAASDVVRATRQMRAMSRELQNAITKELFPILRRLEPDFLKDAAYLQDDFADDIQGVLDRIRADHVDLAEQRAGLIATDMTRRSNERNRERFFSSIETVIGIDIAAVVDESSLVPILKLKTKENVGLIKSIPENYFEQIETMVFENVVQGRTSAKSMIEELREIGAKTDRRARFIARDQTSKLTAAINRERNQALGITEYIWRTARDERVRPTHFAHRGKKFRWDDPPQDTGHPGEDYQCRCVAEPVIVV